MLVPGHGDHITTAVRTSAPKTVPVGHSLNYRRSGVVEFSNTSTPAEFLPQPNVQSHFVRFRVRINNSSHFKSQKTSGLLTEIVRVSGHLYSALLWDEPTARKGIIQFSCHPPTNQITIQNVLQYRSICIFG